MTIFREDDLPAFFSDFGETAVLEGGGEIQVVFDDEYVAAAPMGQEVESSSPQAIGLSSDLENVTHDTTIEIRGVTYRIIGIHPDGQGMTTLIVAR